MAGAANTCHFLDLYYFRVRHGAYKFIDALCIRLKTPAVLSVIIQNPPFCSFLILLIQVGKTVDIRCINGFLCPAMGRSFERVLIPAFI